MDAEILNEEPAAAVLPAKNAQVFNEDFMSIASTVVIVSTFAIINILSYLV